MTKNITIIPARIGCSSLPGTMKGMIASLDGVKDVQVHYESRSLDITYDDALITPEDMISYIGTELGLAMQVK